MVLHQHESLLRWDEGWGGEPISEGGREDLLSVDNSRLGCDKGSEQSLDAALPAPEGGVVGLGHHGTVLPQKLAELFTSGDELWLLQKST